MLNVNDEQGRINDVIVQVKKHLHQWQQISNCPGFRHLRKRGRWFQSDLSINSKRCNSVAPAPYDLKSQWHTIIFHENASSE